MNKRSILLDHVNGREAAALLVDGVLEDILLESDAPAPGTVYRAIADRPVKGQGGMFLKTPDGAAFLRQIKGLAPGQRLLVQVTGYAEKGKALPVTQKILFKSRYAIVTPGAPGKNISRSIKNEEERDRLLEIAHDVMGKSSFGLILRSSCEGTDSEVIADDISAMHSLAVSVLEDDDKEMEVLLQGDTPHVLAWRDWTDPATVISEEGCFEGYGMYGLLDDALKEYSPLDGGAGMFVEPTRALVAIDVNTGRDASINAGAKANLACARALPRVLRLRGLGGQIVIDLAPMPKKDRRNFETALRQAFRHDHIETALVGWTPMGHFELSRKRLRVSTQEVYG